MYLFKVYVPPLSLWSNKFAFRFGVMSLEYYSASLMARFFILLDACIIRHLVAGQLLSRFGMYSTSGADLRELNWCGPS